MKNKGWTKFHREQFSHWISKKPFCDGYAWTYLYGQANHKPGIVNFRNEYIKVGRGQFITSKMKLENIFGWTRRHIDNFLRALENDEMITYRMTNRFTSITIINYEHYQSYGKQNDIQNNKQMADRLHTDDKQVSINKNDNNDINDKNDKNEDTKSEEFFDKNSAVYQLTIYLEGKIMENNKAVNKRNESQIQSWCKDMDKLIRIDKAKPEEIKKIIDWVVKDKFWAKNVLCAESLRKQYPRFWKEALNETKSIKQIAEEDPFDWGKAIGEGEDTND